MSSYNLPNVTRYRFPVISFHDYLHYQRNEKRAECIVELHKHAEIFKNTREVMREFLYFFYKMYRESRALVPST